jgi:predicted metal-dependent hydrolase
MEKTFQTESGPIRVSVTRKRMKNLYLRVLPPEGSIAVSAPLGTSDAEIGRFVTGRLGWIERQRDRISAHRAAEYRCGDTVYYFGKRLRLQVVERTGRPKAEKSGDTLTLSVKPDADPATRKRTLDAWYRKELVEAAGAVLPSCERTVGKRAGELKIRDMKTRWGTCNVKSGAITINLRLAEKSAECLRYVLTHELCHLYEPDHGERFWKRMDEYYPDWKRVRKLLRG